MPMHSTGRGMSGRQFDGSCWFCKAMNVFKIEEKGLLEQSDRLLVEGGTFANSKGHSSASTKQNC